MQNVMLGTFPGVVLHFIFLFCYWDNKEGRGVLAFQEDPAGTTDIFCLIAKITLPSYEPSTAGTLSFLVVTLFSISIHGHDKDADDILF